MASAPDLRRAVAAALAVALTAILAWFGTGLHPWWPLLWFAPLPVLVLAAGASWGRAAIAAAIAWFGGMFSLWHGLHDVLPGPFAVFALWCGTEAAVFTRSMAEIAVGPNPAWTIPAMDFAGVPTGIDIRLVVETGLAPTINTGIAHRDPGVGQVGAGIVKAPLKCFQDALVAFAETMGVE